jgi:hypothetical protein
MHPVIDGQQEYVSFKILVINLLQSLHLFDKLF